MEKKVIHTDKASSGKVPLSQAIQAGEWLYCSGQLPIDPATGEIVPGGAGEQTRQIIENLKAVCEEAGITLANAVKVTIFMADLADLKEMNDVFEEYFGIEDPPARTTFQAGGIIAGAKLEIELTAFIPQ
jgi:2-iminobutanoate/2-iminopropanoate deaminase